MTRDEMLMYPGEYRAMFEMEDTYWWYVGIHTFLQGLLEKYLPTAAREVKILDAGCGTGANLIALHTRGNAFGIDLSAEALGLSRARGIAADHLLLASVIEPAFRDKIFDLAISFDVICNIQDDVAAFAEIRRTLQPNGRLIVQLPAYRFLWSAHDVAVGHKHRYTARDLGAKMEGAGFRIEKLTYLNMTLFPFIALLRFARRPAASNGRAHSDLTPLPHSVNSVLTRLFSAEMRVAPRHRFPYGISLLAVARRVE